MLFLLFASVCAESIVEMINKNPESTWVAIEYPAKVMNVAKFRSRLGTHVKAWTPRVEAPSNAVPENFDSRTQWGDKILPVRDQASCGGCWAFSIAEVIGDRYGILGCSKGVMSPQDLISCDTTDYGCNGGYMDNAWAWTKNHGITTDACLPFTDSAGSTSSCPSKCTNGSAITRYQSTKITQLTSCSAIQTEIMNNGPVGVAFSVYSDFMYYKSGVYQHTYGYLEGGHAVMCTGWGVEDGVNYWLCQNSWNTDWGENGYFKILRGSNHCGIEDQVYAPTLRC